MEDSVADRANALVSIKNTKIGLGLFIVAWLLTQDVKDAGLLALAFLLLAHLFK